MKNKKVLLSLLLIICITCIFTTFAHQGRTDGNGGHRDNNNVSGLGSYHYHCDGYPAHLHSNGYCPYTSTGYSSSNYTSSSDDYDEGYNDGYAKGSTKGYDKGYDEGYDEGYDKAYDVGYKAKSEEIASERQKETTLFLISLGVIVVIVLLVKFIKRRRKE